MHWITHALLTSSIIFNIMKRYTLLHLQQWNLKLKEKVTPAISHVSQITWLDTGLEFWRRDTTKTATDAPPTPIPQTNTKLGLNFFGVCYNKFWLHNMLCNMWRGIEKSPNPKNSTAGDSEKTCPFAFFVLQTNKLVFH